MGRLHEACNQPLEDIAMDDTALMASFPKFVALRKYLVHCCNNQPEFHGMVFVRTRLVRNTHPRHVDSMLRIQLEMIWLHCGMVISCDAPE